MTASGDRLQRWIISALAGMALFGFVLDEWDVPHDNAQGFVVLGAGALTGMIVGALVGVRPALRDGALRIAWDTVRFVLAYEMIRYGMGKLTGMQFYPQYFRLDRRVIDQSPIALAWEFLGRSYWYQAFGGLIEVGSGILICFRRTTLFGALLMTTALLNVVLINYFYGVPVKLFASLYLLFNVALIARDWRRLWAFFFPPVQQGGRSWSRWAYGAVAILVIGGATAKMLREGMQHRVFEREPLEGAWNVDERSGTALAGWERLYFEKDDVGFIRVGKTQLVPFQKQLEGSQLRLILRGEKGGSPAISGTVVAEGQTMRFDGTCDDQPCAMKLTREYPR